MNKTLLVRDQLKYFQQYSKDIETKAGSSPVLYAVTVRPKKRHILILPHIGSKYFPEFDLELDRLTFAETLVQRLLYRVQNELIRKPTKPRNKLRLIRSRNCIESHTRFGLDDMHHSHGVWSIHPELAPKFQELLVPINPADLNERQRDASHGGKVYAFNQELLGPLSEYIHSVQVEPCTDLELALDYFSKNISAKGPLNSWSTFDTPTH